MNEEYPTKYVEKIIKIEPGEFKLVDEGRRGPVIVYEVLDSLLQHQNYIPCVFEDKDWFESQISENSLPPEGKIVRVRIRSEYDEQTKDYYSYIEKVIKVIK